MPKLNATALLLITANFPQLRLPKRETHEAAGDLC